MRMHKAYISELEGFHNMMGISLRVCGYFFLNLSKSNNMKNIDKAKSFSGA